MIPIYPLIPENRQTRALAAYHAKMDAAYKLMPVEATSEQFSAYRASCDAARAQYWAVVNGSVAA